VQHAGRLKNLDNLTVTTGSDIQRAANGHGNKEVLVMSGHSKWATIKHKKAATDAKRGAVFTRVIREITIAARIGGGDPISNPRLRTAILAGKNENMPNDNIERAILRGTGQLEGEQYEEVTFEGYGPGGVGILIQAVTTNRNRIVGEFRHMMSKNGGNLAEAGAVGWMFHRKGEITVPKEQASEEKMLDIVLEAGAEDLKDDGSSWYIVTPPEALEKVKEALTKAGITPESAEVAMVPQNYVKLTGAQATQMVRLIEALEEHDDVQHVYANFDIDESEIQAAVGAN
jgi:YebC/PmpR family DNA-binding regulatory protein